MSVNLNTEAPSPMRNRRRCILGECDDVFVLTTARYEFRRCRVCDQHIIRLIGGWLEWVYATETEFNTYLREVAAGDDPFAFAFHKFPYSEVEQ